MSVHYLHPDFDRTESNVRLGVTSNESFKKTRLDHQLRVLEITEMLHRKVDLSLLLECFFIETQSFVRHDGLSFQQRSHFPAVFFGSQRQHTSRFELSLGDDLLGEISFYRSTAFPSRDERELERLVAHLCYPLAKSLDHQAQVQATLVDDLTGLNNRLALEQSLPREITLARRNDMPMSLLLLDIDRFSEVNASHGEQVGDDILRTVATTLANSIRKSDMIFHYDSDTFAIVMNGTEYNGAKVLAERIRKVVDVCYQYRNVQVMLSASAGITELVENDTAGELLERASEALLNAKKAGRNTLRALDVQQSHLSLV
ncbi:MAG: GGDEF domain-containing protein [Granulosicoccus sp.]|nr:GGDEF domain-containing protein [Granulosicoccus sp.]